MNTLQEPLQQRQLDAASRFWDVWQDEELIELQQDSPNRCRAVYSKVSVLNKRYSAGLKDKHIAGVAEALKTLLKEMRTIGPLLVEELVDNIKLVTKQNNYSFAAKFGHFFIDSTLPILDSYAEEMVWWHLGSQLTSRNPKRYLAFCENLEALRQYAGLTASIRDMDAYLWVAGEYRAWRSGNEYINGELKNALQSLHENPESAPDLRGLLGPLFKQVTCRSYVDQPSLHQT